MKNPLQIDSDDVAALSKDDLPRIMNRLLGLEARCCRIQLLDVETSLRVNDADGGIDARIRSNEIENPWLPQGLSIWQFKAGSNITASDILKEVKKSGVRQGLAEGGTYCLVVSTDFIPKKIDDIKSWLDDAIAKVQPDAPHRLLTASLVAQWATQHPSMLFSFNRPVYGIWPLDAWLKRQPIHQVPFQGDETRTDIMKDVQQRFASDAGPVHIRIQGASGVGKTRLALEIFHSSQEGLELALYAPEPPENDFFYWMASHSQTTATLVVDECLPAQAVQMSNLVQMSEHRLRLMTVGPAQGLGSDMDVYGLSPLQDTTLASVVEATAPTLSYEQIWWIVRVAKGYVNLAVVLARKVAQGRMTAVDLATTFEVGQLLTGLLPDQRSRQAMRGLSLLTRVGWDGDVSSDGKAIAHFIGMQWEEMREMIGQAMREGLVSKQGRYRYVTPELLAFWLAADEWQSRQKDLLKLLEELSRAEARNTLVERLVQLAGLKEAAQTIESFLSPPGAFDNLVTLNDERMAQLFSFLAKGHSQAAFEVLERLLYPATHEQLLDFTQGRSAIVQTLRRLARRKETFAGAARLLLRLAEAENQTWGKNATDAWTGLFLTYAGATEVPPLERYPLLREALQSDVPVTRMLAVIALSKALSIFETGDSMGEMQDGYVPPKRWNPTTWEEEWAARREALCLLDTALSDTDTQIQDKACEVLFDIARGIVTRGLVEEIITRFGQLDMLDGNQRQRAWITVQEILKYEASCLTEDQCRRLESQSEHFLGNSLHDRIRRYVGRPTIVDTPRFDHLPEDQRPPAIVARLADEAMEETDVLREELPWLMSRDAERAWYFGYRLGMRDEAYNWLNELVEVAKVSQGSLLLSAYLRGRAEAGESEWCEHLLDTWMEDASYATLVFDTTWHGEANARAAKRLVTLVDRGWVAPTTLSRLVGGRWILSLDAPNVSALLERLARDTSSAASEAGLALLVQWTEAQKGEIPEALAPITWTLVERSIATSTHMVDFYWEQVGLTLLQQDAVRITRAVLSGIVAGNIRCIDERLNILRKAFALKPVETWEVFADQLLKHQEVSYGLRPWVGDNSVIDGLDANLLLAWARQEPEQRSRLLARLIKPKETITPLVRGLLKEHGPDSASANLLAANFNSGFWSGSWLQHETQRLEIMKEWCRDPEPNVRLWVQRLITATQQHLPDIKQMEEEGWPHSRKILLS